MRTNVLADVSSHIADLVDHAATSVVQVQGRRRPATGVAFRSDVVVTTTRALGHEHGIKIRLSDGRVHDAEFKGWDPPTGIAVLRVAEGGLSTLGSATADVRVGHLLIGLARSWSNVVTATAGVVAVIGGPLPTGPGRSIARVIRTTAPMHSGFAGGAVLDTSGLCVGLATATAIRGLSVVIPHDIVWRTAEALIEHGTPRRGYLGIAGQPVTLAERQRDAKDRTDGLLVVAVSTDSPAADAGLLVGDVIIAADGEHVRSPIDLLPLLDGDRIGRTVGLRILRGEAMTDLSVTVGTRPVS